MKDYAASQYADTKNLGIMKIVVAADSAEGSLRAMMTKGALQAVTPLEEILAPYLALANDMTAGRLAPSDVAAWLTFFRTALFTFKVLPTQDDKEFATIGIRQQAAARFFTISPTRRCCGCARSSS